MKVDFGAKKTYHVDTNGKINAIKCIRECLGTGLKEAKDLVEADSFIMPERLAKMLDVYMQNYGDKYNMEQDLQACWNEENTRTPWYGYVSETTAATLEVEV